jgi:hypothetical protein
VDEGPSPGDLMLLADAIIEANIDIRIEAYANLAKAWASDERAGILYKAGFRQLFLGIETVNRGLLQEVEKELNDPSLYRDILDCLARNGLMNYGFFIVGLPGSDKTVDEETERFIAGTASLHTVAVASFIPISNSPMYTDDDFKAQHEVEFKLLGDLTTRCAMVIGGVSVTDTANQETETMVKRIFGKRMDLWVTSNLPYEARFYMCTEYGNKFGLELAAACEIPANDLRLSKEMTLRAKGLRHSE